VSRPGTEGAPAFAGSAKGIAEITGFGTTFVGTWLVGLSTSLPELASSIAALRLGASDLAVGNRFGSNAFNMAIFFALDLASPAPIFSGLDSDHAISGLFAVVLMGLGLAAIVYRADRHLAVVEPDSVLMVVVHALGIWLLYSRVAVS
jgi:cation:H+ antiporter